MALLGGEGHVAAGAVLGGPEWPMEDGRELELVPISMIEAKADSKIGA